MEVSGQASFHHRQVAPDFLKGFCISLMVYGHIAYIGKLASIQDLIQDFIYTFHMPIFLVVSGFFYSKFEDDAKTKLVKIIRRLAVPYLIFMTLYLLGLLLIQKTGIPTTNIPPSSTVNFFKTLLVRPYGALWFLHSLFLIQLAIAFASAASSYQKNKNIVPVLLASLVLELVLSQLHVVKIHNSLYFMIGILVGLLSRRKLSISPVPCFICIIIVLWLSSFDTVGIYGSFSVYQLAWCLLLFSFLWSLSSQLQKTLFVKILAWLGRNSISILVLHALFNVLLKPAGPSLLKLDSSGILNSVIVTSATISLCLVSSLILDKLGLSRYLFGTFALYRRFNPSDS